jgi:hypothetical protein
VRVKGKVIVQSGWLCMPVVSLVWDRVEGGVLERDMSLQWGLCLSLVRGAGE